MNTKWQIKEKNNGVTVSEYNNKLLIDMKAPIWANIYLVSNSFPCEERKIYKINIDTNDGKADVRLLVEFYGDENEYPYRRYITSDDEFCVPDKMNRFEVSAVITTKEDTVVTLGDVTYEYVKDYEPKNVRLCSVSNVMVPDEALGSQSDIVHAYLNIIDEIAVKENPDIIVLTEHFHTIGLKTQIPLSEHFVSYDDESVTLIAEKAKKHGIYIAASYRMADNGCRYNRGILFDRQGEIIAEYDKTHLVITEYQDGIKPGDGITVVDTDIGRIGFIICWDIFFPEIIRMYYQAGCDILVCPTRGDAECQNQAATYTSGTFLVSASNERMTLIQDKGGKVIDEAGEKGYAVATVNLNEPLWRPRLSVGAYNGEGKNIYIRERRPEIYGNLSKKNIME